MSAPPIANRQPIDSKQQLIAYFESGCKPPEAWRIGTEHEKFVFHRSDLRPVSFDGRMPDGTVRTGIRDILSGMCRFDWDPVEERGNLIALVGRGPLAGCSITLEPGGQFELSGAPLETLHQTCNEVNTHLAQCKIVGDELGVGMIGLGFQPKWTRAETPVMPKGRHDIMRAYMPKVGSLGLDMMLRTCTIQTNLDFSSERDMVEKFRVSLALQPIATALFANSPFTEGAPNNFQSYRSHTWTDTDPDRCGTLPFVFDAGFGFERYVDYILDVPMYFVYRDGRYIDVAGQSFRDFMAGRLPGLPGERPTMGDFADHITVAFPEVRLKKYLEMRGADGGPWRRICALPALWVGLLYDATAQSDAATLVRDWTAEDHAYLRAEVPRYGLRTKFRSGTVQDLAREVLTIARDGLHRRARLDSTGQDERMFLAVLHETAETGKTAAEELVEKYRHAWGASVDPVFKDYAY